MKSKLYIFIGLLCILLVVGLFIVNLNNKSEKDTQKEKIEDFSISKESSEICIDKNCENKVVYPIIELDGNRDEVQEVLDEINNKTNELYEEAKESDMSSDICQFYLNEYTHSISYNIDYSLYTTEDYISIMIQRIKSNLCTKENEYLEPEVYLYDKKENKFIGTEDFLKKEKISNEKVQTLIKENILLYNKYMSTNYTIDNTYQNGEQYLKVYYSGVGGLCFLYKQNEDGTYHVATLQ